jgi:hypothetical protein
MIREKENLQQEDLKEVIGYSVIHIHEIVNNV